MVHPLSLDLFERSTAGVPFRSVVKISYGMGQLTNQRPILQRDFGGREHDHKALELQTNRKGSFSLALGVQVLSVCSPSRTHVGDVILFSFSIDGGVCATVDGDGINEPEGLVALNFKVAFG